MYTIGNPSVRLIDITTTDCVHKTGDEIIEGSKTFTNPIIANVNGNANTATKLQTAHTINGVPFDGTANISIHSLPVASVIPSMTDLTPYGFLHMNGDTFSVAAFPDLAKALGAPEGATTFTLPNGIGRVLWGSDTAGQYIEAGLPNIEAQAQQWSNEGSLGEGAITSGAFYKEDTPLPDRPQYRSETGYPLGFDASRSNPIYGNSDTVQPPALTVRFYIKAYDVAVTESQAQVAGLIDAVQGKVSLDGSNLTPDTTVKTVVETWHKGTEWYRLWSDGWLEQGGTQTGITVNLKKPYTSTIYTTYIVWDNNVNTSGGSNAGLVACTKSTSNFTVYYHGGAFREPTVAYNWYACGMADTSN